MVGVLQKIGPVTRSGWWLASGALLLALLVLGSAWYVRGMVLAAPDGQPRLVSLSPALTETLFAIGAGELVVGVSDYCRHPEPAARLAKVGTSITPNYEAIVALAPSLIVTEAAVNARPSSLERLAPTATLPWLTLDDVVQSTRRLGKLTGRFDAAEALADDISRRLSVTPAQDAPRVLLVLGYGSDQLDEVWFIRRNSMHGAALRAAGARNAVARDVWGQPRLSLEQVIALDPDMVIVLLNERARQTERVERQWRQIEPLTAVQRGRVRVVFAPEAFSNGPRILKLVDRLKSELEAMGRR